MSLQAEDTFELHAQECHQRHKRFLESTPYKLLDESLRRDKEITLAALVGNGLDLRFALGGLGNDKDVVKVACSQNGHALEYASQELKKNKEVVLQACSQRGRFGSPLEHASDEMKRDKEVVLLACSQDGFALEFASEALQKDKEVVMAACTEDGCALQFAGDFDEEVVLKACTQNGMALEHAKPGMQADKDVVLAACSQNGEALKYASDALRGNKEVILTAVESNPESLKFALAGLNQDRDCLIKAGLFDENYLETKVVNNCLNIAEGNKKKIVLSTKFSLTTESSPHATKFTVELKQHPYIAAGNFAVYSPNSHNKDTCDPNWTDKRWPCRGTYTTCRKPRHLKMGVPGAECCWRYSYRYHLKEAFYLNGFMIQVVDRDGMFGGHSLGDGQAIETEMGQDVGIKMFHFFEPIPGQSYAQQLDELVGRIQEWYKDEQSKNINSKAAPEANENNANPNQSKNIKSKATPGANRSMANPNQSKNINSKAAPEANKSMANPNQLLLATRGASSGGNDLGGIDAFVPDTLVHATMIDEKPVTAVAVEMSRSIEEEEELEQKQMKKVICYCSVCCCCCCLTVIAIVVPVVLLT